MVEDLPVTSGIGIPFFDDEILLVDFRRRVLLKSGESTDKEKSYK
jgi:hypothetical protein